MKLIGFCKFFNDKINLERMLNQMKEICDDIILCDDSSSDGSKEIASRYTDHIITLPDDFEDEGAHKQRMLEYIKDLSEHEGWTGQRWILSLDSDETLDKPEEIKELCEFLDSNGYDSAYFHLRNLWMSETQYRIDSAFNSLWKNSLWKFSDKLKFDVSKGLHKPQTPLGLEKTFHSNIQIIHYGFASRDLIQKKYDTYKKFQSGWALERLNPESPARLKFAGSNPAPPHLSVGVPAYIDTPLQLNFFKQCLNSIIEQWNENTEVLVVNDGSPFWNDMKNICEVLEVRYISNEKNLGIGFTRNRIINEAKGEKLFFLSADDMFLPNAVDTLMNLNENAFYFFNYNINNG
ncbi:MAG: glycosyltransferase, partial [Nanoarchaeota archaeon]